MASTRWLLGKWLEPGHCEVDQGDVGPAWRDEDIAAALDVTVTGRSIQNWRKKAVLKGPKAALVGRGQVVDDDTPSTVWMFVEQLGCWRDVQVSFSLF